MAIVYSGRGRYEEALELYEWVLAGHEKALGKEHASTLRTVNSIALVYDNQGLYEEALEWYRRALAGYEKALGKEHPSTMNTANNMAICQEILEHADRNREDSWGVARIDAAHG